MNIRLAILALTKAHQLSARDHAELRQLAGLDEPPAALGSQLQRGIALLGAALGGLGILFWIAANWQLLSHAGRFALLETVLALTLLGAWRRPSARVPLSLLGFLTCGGLFAQLGQTYQTGADPWQLFALWAALSLPLCASVRHDALWTVWAVVALTATLLGISEPFVGSVLYGSLGSWVPAIALALIFRAAGRGVWPVRLCMIYAAIGLAVFGLFSLFGQAYSLMYLVILAAIAALGVAFSQRKLFDVFVISALALCADVLLVAGAARLLLDSQMVGYLLIGCFAAVVLGVTVKYITHLTRAMEEA